MKKVLLLLVMFGMLSAVTPGYAADVDGAWLVSIPSKPIAALAMLRANGGQLLATWCGWDNGNMDFWGAFLGPFDGTNGQISLILTSQAIADRLPQSMTGNFTLTSATTATFTPTSCIDFPGHDDCVGTVGLLIQFEKLF